MAGGSNYPTSLIRVVMWKSKTTAVAYGAADWPSRWYRLWVWEAE